MEVGTSHAVTAENKRPLGEAQLAAISAQRKSEWLSGVPMDCSRALSPRRGQVSLLSLPQPRVLPAEGEQLSSPHLPSHKHPRPNPGAQRLDFLFLGPFPATPTSGSFSLLSQETL